MTKKDFGFGTQIRKSPYFDATVKWGATGFSVYNHMYIPRDFGDPEKNFWNLINDAILCDVAVERQVEITGPDAAEFVQLLTPRDLSKLSIGQCKYVLITNNEGGLLNDPVLLRIAENHFWLSLGDSDILLWAQGVAINSELNVTIREPDVSPLQLQGPKSIDIMKVLFGDQIVNMKYIYLLREPCEWIESFVSMLIYYYQLYGINKVPQWMTNYGAIYSPNFNWTYLVRLTEDPSCESSQLIFSDFLDLWIKENLALLKFCKNRRVCYLETSSISNSLAKLASFAQVLDSTLCLETHANKGKFRQYFLSEERKEYILHQTTKIVREFKKRADE